MSSKRKHLLPVVLLVVMVTLLFSVPVMATITGPDNLTVTVGQPIPVMYSSSSFIINWISETNVTVYRDGDSGLPPNSQGVFYVAGLKAGTGQFTISDGQETKTVTVNILPGKALCIDGCLTDYYTRSNTFEAYIKNYSSSTITIKSTKAKAYDCDYKTFDRSLRLKGSGKIKPGVEKRILFKVKGRTTWPDVDDFYVKCKIKYGKKTYDMCIYPEGYVVLKMGGTWINTMIVTPQVLGQQLY